MLPLCLAQLAAQTGHLNARVVLGRKNELSRVVWQARGRDKIFTNELGGRQAAPGLGHNIWGQGRSWDEAGHKLSGRTAIVCGCAYILAQEGTEAGERARSEEPKTVDTG